MRVSLRAAIGILFLSFVVVIFMGIMNVQMQISKLNDYHYAAVQEMESSDFSPVVINRIRSNGEYTVNVEDKTLKEDMRIYQVTTSKKISLPILNFEKTYVKERGMTIDDQVRENKCNEPGKCHAWCQKSHEQLGTDGQQL